MFRAQMFSCIRWSATSRILFCYNHRNYFCSQTFHRSGLQVKSSTYCSGWTENCLEKLKVGAYTSTHQTHRLGWNVKSKWVPRTTSIIDQAFPCAWKNQKHIWNTNDIKIATLTGRIRASTPDSFWVWIELLVTSYHIFHCYYCFLR